MGTYKGYGEVWSLWEGTMPLRVTYEHMVCKFCGSKNIVKYGSFRGVQRWWCKDCQRKFADNDALPGMKTPVVQIASALSMYYGGMSLNGIRRHLDQQYENHPSDSTVYGWITRFTRKAINSARAYKPNVGSVWIADETVLKIGGRNIWFWDIIDIKPRFLLASHISTTRTTKDARQLMEKASERAGKTPRVVITDKLHVYLDGIELAFGADTKHIPAKSFTTQPNTTLIERFHGSIKDRLKVMRGLKRHDTARLLTNGWLVHYNFFRPHESLTGKTPAEKAGIEFPLENWADVVRKRDKPSRKGVIMGEFLVDRPDPHYIGPVTTHNRRKARTRKRKTSRRGVAGLGMLR